MRSILLCFLAVTMLGPNCHAQAANAKDKPADLSLTAVGRYEDSAEALRQFLKSHGDRPEAMTARRWLEGLAKNGKIRQD